MSKFLIACDGLCDGLFEEFWVVANTPEEAKKLLWDEYLSDWQRDAVQSMEVIEEI